MHGRVFVVVLGLAGVLGGSAPVASATECGSSSECGVPSCFEPKVRARPDMPRALSVYCGGLTAAEVIAPPAYGHVSNVRADYNQLRFDLHATAEAPREDSVVFRLAGQEGSIEQRVEIQVIPTSENSAPRCYGDRVSQRTPGDAPVELFMHPSCYDPDGDEFTMEGGGPGTHALSPKAVPAGSGEANWRYRTATHAGSETATVWATDVLGARSETATLDVTIGPGIDRLPECRPASATWTPDGVFTILARAGATRRFGIVCTDADADPIEPRLSSAPERGQMPVFLPGLPQEGFWGVERWIDAVYVPADESSERDEFAVTATGERGDGPVARMAIVPVPFTENGGAGCGWSPAQITKDVPGGIKFSCDDREGDELSVEIVSDGLHGTAGPGAVIPARQGWSDFVIPYVPDPGYTGYDCVKVAVTDGHGFRMEMNLDIWVTKAPGPSFPNVPAPPLPVVPELPEMPDDLVEKFARHVLGSKDVRRAAGSGRSDIWTPARLSKSRLLRDGRAPSVLVVCGARCTVRTESRLATGAARRARSAKRKTALVAESGEARVVWLTVERGERKALRRAKRPRAELQVRMRVRGAPPGSVERSLRIGR